MGILDLLINITGQRLVFPFYHVVSDEILPHVRNLYSVKSVKVFRKELDFFLRHYQPLDVEDVESLAQSGEKYSKKGILLSFDDGHRECFEIIAPILQEKGIPAIFFVNSAFVDNQALFFRYKVSLCIERLNTLPEKHFILSKISSLIGLPFANKQMIRKYLLSLGYHEEKMIQAIADVLAVSFEDFLKTSQPYLSSCQISNLLANGFRIGAHSIDHPYYYKIPFSEQVRQTEASLIFLENKFGIKEKYFSFPFTDFCVSAAFFRYFYDTKDKNSPRLNLSFGCAGLKIEKEPLHFQRIPMETGKANISKRLLSTYLGFILKSVIGKNSIIR